ncbi:MAG: hypothetical protein Q9184_003709, partial [Pyrenodesmia sp. 2 TL-2023]
PIPLLWRLRTSFNQKLVLTAIFTAAGFVVIVSIIRITVLSRIGKTDLTWNYINGGIWAAAEPSVAVICACLPSLRPLFSLLFSLTPDIPGRISKRFSLNTNISSSNRWIRRNKSNSNDEEVEDSRSRLDNFEARGKPLSHDVEVRGGDGVKREMEMGEGIRVKTEVTLVSSERLDYRDRLF